MDNNDKQLTELFRRFNPDLSPDSRFMSRLQRSMEAVEALKRDNEYRCRRSRVAVVVAAVAGFIAGALMTMFVLYITGRIPSVEISLFNLPALQLTDGLRTLLWVLTAGTSVIISLNSYELVMSRQATSRKS